MDGLKRVKLSACFLNWCSVAVMVAMYSLYSYDNLSFSLSCAMPRFVGARGSIPVTSTSLEAEKRSRVRERRREGRYKTYDWSEFCKNRPTNEESAKSTTAQQQQPPQDSSSSPPATSSSLPTTSSLPSTTSLCSTSGQPIRDGPQKGEGSEHAGDKTPINSSGSSISAAQASLPPVLCLTLPGESDSSFHGDGSDRRRTDEGRGGLTFDLREERRDSEDNDKGDIKALKVRGVQNHIQYCTHTHNKGSTRTKGYTEIYTKSA